MAAVDSLLRFIAARHADGLVIRSTAVPELRKAGAPMPLSMPPLSAALVGGFLAEIGGPSVREYTSGDGARFAVTVQGQGETLQMSFTRQDDAGPRPVALAKPPAVVNSPSPLAGGLDELLRKAREMDASDLVLSSDCNAWVRVAGAMHALPNTAMSREQILEALQVDVARLDEHGSLDFALEAEQRYRVNVFRKARGIAAALRPIRTQPPSLAQLQLPQALGELARLRNGLVLIAGTAGSGKSTTLAAMIEELNRGDAKHIITLEDPIEYEYRNASCLIHQREIGRDVPDFASGLRAALRESPDIIMVGELRDRETIAAAITAAETGHLVFATIHASCATVAIDRMIDVFPGDQQRQIQFQLASILRATLTQFLLPSLTSAGRVPAIELMRSTAAVAAHIREGKTQQIPSAIQTGRAQGMIALEHSLAGLVREQHVAYDVALAAAKEVDLFQQLAG